MWFVENDSKKQLYCISTKENSGTQVIFDKVFDLSIYYFENNIEYYLKKEFSWFLEVKKSSGYQININGNPLSYDNLIKDKDKDEYKIDIKGNTFYIKYIRWSNKLNHYFSRYYCSGSDSNFKYSKPTKLNNKGDKFYHSIFITSDFFNNFVCEEKSKQIELISHSTESPEFKELISNINTYLKEKREPFIVSYSSLLVENYENIGVFPSYNSNNRWETIRYEDIKNTVKQLYQVEPKIFSKLNKVQKKTFVNFITLIIDSGDINDLFNIIDGVVNLSSEERERFSKQLKYTKLSSIVHTIELVSDRYKSVEAFKSLVFDPTMYAGEVPHLQKMMEKNYWLLGEEYQLLTAEDPKFEEALRRHRYLLTGENKRTAIEHKDKNREMDLFLVRREKKNNRIAHIVVELKHPINVRLGKDQVDQIYKYYQVISSEPQFNASNMDWKFYLIGNRFDSTGYIQEQIDALKSHGEPGLTHIGKYKVYTFKWSEIFTEFELRHDFLNEKLQIELERLAVDKHDSANDIVKKYRSSDAKKELKIP